MRPPAAPPRRAAHLAAPARTLLLAVLAATVSACSSSPSGGGPTAPGGATPTPAATATSAALPSPTASPAAARNPSGTPAASPSPRPAATPVEIFGGVVIKLPRGADVAAGLPVHLLDRETLEAGAVRESVALAEELRARRRALALALDDAREAEASLLAAARRAVEAWSTSWREAHAAESPVDPLVANQFLQLTSTSDVAFLAAPPPIGPNVAEALAFARGLEGRVRAERDRLADEAARVTRDLEKSLEEERALYERTYRHRPDTRQKSETNQRDLATRLEHNPHVRLRGILESTLRLGRQREAAPLEEMLELERRLQEDVAARIAAARGWIERDFPTRQARAFERIVGEARREVFHADKDGGFRFRVAPAPAGHALYAIYVDQVTGQEYVWLQAAKVGEQTLSTYNTISDESLADLPGVRALLFSPQSAAAQPAPAAPGPTPSLPSREPDADGH